MNDDGPRRPPRRTSLLALGLAFGMTACSTVDSAPSDSGGTTGGVPNACSTGQVVKVAGVSSGSKDLIYNGTLVLDATNVYWAGRQSGSLVLLTTPKAGGAVSVVASYDLGFDTFVADEANLYVVVAGQSGRRIEVLPKSGGVAQTLVPKVGSVQSIAVTKDRVAWIEGSGTLMSVPKTGGSPTTFVEEVDESAGLAADADRVYWVSKATNDFASHVESTPSFGGTSTVLAEVHGALSLAVDDTRVYWTDSDGSNGVGSVMAVAKGGGTRTTVVNDGLALIQRVAVAGSCAYWTGDLYGKSRVMAAPKAGGEAGTVSVAHALGAIAADESGVYWVTAEFDGAPGQVWKLAR